tara:strand:- start:434 stop:634 length:201 start_codon:yes stop_codon:yes gene_type:complete
LERVVSLNATVTASGSLAYFVGYGIASYDSYQICYREHRMVLTKAAGNAKLVLGDVREFGHWHLFS